MSGLRDTRAALVQALAEGDWTTHNGVPAQVDPPCFIVQPADPYIEPDEDAPFGGDADLIATVDVWALAEYDDNDQADDDLDVMLAHALDAIAAAGWSFVRGGQPEPVTVSGTLAFGAALTANTRHTQGETAP